MKQKIDLAVQSYKKPELLFYTLLSLKEFSENVIDQVWIQDDSNDESVLGFYNSDFFKNALKPWKIHVKANSQRVGWWFTPVENLYPQYLSIFKRILFSIRAKQKGTGFSLKRENVRYQWAIDHTDKSYLMIIHDDIIFYKDVASIMLNKISIDENTAIVGDLGQCWRCDYKKVGCDSDKVNAGYRPSIIWPQKEKESTTSKWPCRINEWCCMISVSKAVSIEKKYNVLFGNCDNHGDTAAYWFNLVQESDYSFKDIAPSHHKKNLFLHADGGSGHSVWVDQGDGKKIYDPVHIKNKIKNEFGVVFNP